MPHQLPIQYRWDDVGSSYRRVYPQGACVVFHGSIALATRIADDALWQPGAWFTRENYNCSTYYCHLAPFLLNADYVMLPFGELRRRKQFLFDHFASDGAIFVRPDSVAKSFTGHREGKPHEAVRRKPPGPFPRRTEPDGARRSATTAIPSAAWR
jgi:hypothetical protein